MNRPIAAVYVGAQPVEHKGVTHYAGLPGGGIMRGESTVVAAAGTVGGQGAA